MQYENREEQKAFYSFNRLFGIHPIYPKGSSKAQRDSLRRREHNNRRQFYRECSLLQATLKGYRRAVKLQYQRIHARGKTVDHIVPLNGHDADGNHVVCGLNVPWNLRGETKEKNQQKGDLFVDSPDAIAIILTHRPKQKRS